MRIPTLFPALTTHPFEPCVEVPNCIEQPEGSATLEGVLLLTAEAVEAPTLGVEVVLGVVDIDVVDPPPAMVVELDPTTVVLEPAGVVLVILVELEEEPGNMAVEDDAIDGAAVEEGLTAEVELLVDDDAVVVTVWASAPKVRRPNETIDEDSKTAKLRP
jgi:hypothetical protein